MRRQTEAQRSWGTAGLRDGGGRGDVSLQQRLVEQQRASCGAVLLQTEDEVPEVNSCDPLTELLTGRAGHGGACTWAHLQDETGQR